MISVETTDEKAGVMEQDSDGVSDLESHLGYWLRLVSNHVSASFAQKLQERRLSVAEWVTLRLLYAQSEITPGELALRLGMTRGAVSKILDKLEEKSLTVSVRNPQDQRSQTLSLTDDGTRLVPELATIADNNDRLFFDCLTPEERKELRRLMEKLAAFHDWKASPID
jgi:DNA-binding MarR family transcriptional regulator